MVCFFHLMQHYIQQNVLVDNSGRALLCDFGLAHVKADITSCTMMADLVAVAGSCHWMVPEQLMGRPLRKPSDIHAFGITVHFTR
jgi:serine/threonine protein kinase